VNEDDVVETIFQRSVSLDTM